MTTLQGWEFPVGSSRRLTRKTRSTDAGALPGSELPRTAAGAFTLLRVYSRAELNKFVSPADSGVGNWYQSLLGSELPKLICPHLITRFCPFIICSIK